MRQGVRQGLLRVEVVGRSGVSGIGSAWVRRMLTPVVTYCVSHTRFGVGVAVVFVGEKRMRTFNRAYRGKSYPTNVLAFPNSTSYAPRHISDEEGERTLGDIILCMRCIVQEARTSRIPVKVHATHLLIHGMLHLLGYDHNKDKDAKKMESMEQYFLKTLPL